MHCLICNTIGTQSPAKDSNDFSALFGHIVAENAGYWWAIDGGSYDPWHWPPEWIDDDEILDPIYDQLRPQNAAFNNYQAVVRNDLFAQYCRYLSDFWVDVIAFPGQPRLVTKQTYKIDGLPELVEFPNNAAHYFLNVDGCLWAMITHERSELDRVNSIWDNSVYANVQRVR